MSPSCREDGNGADTGITQLPGCEGPLGDNEQGHYGNIFPVLQSRLSLSPPQWQLWLLVTAGGNYNKLWTGGKKSQLNNKHWTSVGPETIDDVLSVISIHLSQSFYKPRFFELYLKTKKYFYYKSLFLIGNMNNLHIFVISTYHLSLKDFSEII